MDLDIIQCQINDIEDKNIKSVLSLIHSNLKQLRNETRERSRKIEDRINNISSILIKKTNKEDLEKVMAGIT